MSETSELILLYTILHFSVDICYGSPKHTFVELLCTLSVVITSKRLFLGIRKGRIAVLHTNCRAHNTGKLGPSINIISKTQGGYMSFH